MGYGTFGPQTMPGGLPTGGQAGFGKLSDWALQNGFDPGNTEELNDLLKAGSITYDQYKRFSTDPDSMDDLIEDGYLSQSEYGKEMYGDAPKDLQVSDLYSPLQDFEAKSKALDDRTLSPTGTSTWGQMMLGKQSEGEKGMYDRMLSDLTSQTATARSELAQRGGLDSGAQTFLEDSAAKSRMFGGQDIARQGVADRFGLRAEDYRNQLASNQAKLGMDTQRLGMWGNMAAQDAASKNALLMGNKEFQRKLWGTQAEGYGEYK